MSDSPDSPENPHAGQGSVLLDIGGDVGAIVVEMPVDMVGREVDIVPFGQEHEHDDVEHDHGHGHGHGHGHDHGGRRHVAVVRRPAFDGTLVPSLVFPDVTQGRYSLLHKGGHDVVLTVDVVGGEVTTSTWPGVEA